MPFLNRSKIMKIAVRKIIQFQLKSLIQFRSAQSLDLLQNSERNKLSQNSQRGNSTNFNVKPSAGVVLRNWTSTLPKCKVVNLVLFWLISSN